MGMIDGLWIAYVVACEMMPGTTVSNKHRRDLAELPYTLVFDSME